jgi:hypothetical protein
MFVKYISDVLPASMTASIFSSAINRLARSILASRSSFVIGLASWRIEVSLAIDGGIGAGGSFSVRPRCARGARVAAAAVRVADIPRNERRVIIYTLWRDQSSLKQIWTRRHRTMRPDLNRSQYCSC